MTARSSLTRTTSSAGGKAAPGRPQKSGDQGPTLSSDMKDRATVRVAKELGIGRKTFERRHLSLPERAAATALTLAQNGNRENGRWKYSALSETAPNDDALHNSSWRKAMANAGLVFDIEVFPGRYSNSQGIAPNGL